MRALGRLGDVCFFSLSFTGEIGGDFVFCFFFGASETSGDSRE